MMPVRRLGVSPQLAGDQWPGRAGPQRGLKLPKLWPLAERSTPTMYDLLIVVVALVTFVALGAFVFFCERL